MKKLQVKTTFRLLGSADHGADQTSGHNDQDHLHSVPVCSLVLSHKSRSFRSVTHVSS